MAVSEQKPLGRIALKRQKAKQEILDTALAILADQGVEGLTLAAVAEELGFTKPALYHYFRSKEDLFRSLILELLRQETIALIDAVSKSDGRATVLGTLIRAFYNHYRSQLNAYRLVHCQFQLMDVQALGIDKDTIQHDINPLTHRLFDIVVSILSNNGQFAATSEMRRLAFSAWLAAVGLINMLGVVDAGNDPLKHSDEALLTTLEDVFNAAAEQMVAKTPT